MIIKAGELKSFLAEALSLAIKEYTLSEKSPPGMKHAVEKAKESIKKQHPDWSEDRVAKVAFGHAWNQYKGKNETVDEATPPPIPAAALQQKQQQPKPGTPPPVPNAAKKQASEKAAKAAYQQAIQAAMQQLGPLSPNEKKAAWDQFVSAIETQGMQQMKLPPMVEEENTSMKESKITKVTVSEMRDLIRNSLKEAFGLGGDTGPTGGFGDGEKGSKSGTFADGGKKENPLKEENTEAVTEGAQINLINLKDLQEEIKKAVKEMMSWETEEIAIPTEEGYEAPVMREEGQYEDTIRLEEGSLGWGYNIVDVASGVKISVLEDVEHPSLARSLGWEGSTLKEAQDFLNKHLNETFKDPGYFERTVAEGKKKMPPWLKKGKGKDKEEKPAEKSKKDDKGDKKGKENKDKKDPKTKPSDKEKPKDPMAKVRAAKKD